MGIVASHSSAVVILFNGFISRKGAEAQKGIFLRVFAPLRANFLFKRITTAEECDARMLGRITEAHDKKSSLTVGPVAQNKILHFYC